MVCLRCGYCCIEYMVVIVDDPAKGLAEGNAVCKESGERCKHLVGEGPGNYSCALHDYRWYKKTPCFSYGQIERSPTDPCRMGEHILSKKAPTVLVRET